MTTLSIFFSRKSTRSYALREVKAEEEVKKEVVQRS